MAVLFKMMAADITDVEVWCGTLIRSDDSCPFGEMDGLDRTMIDTAVTKITLISRFCTVMDHGEITAGTKVDTQTAADAGLIDDQSPFGGLPATPEGNALNQS